MGTRSFFRQDLHHPAEIVVYAHSVECGRSQQLRTNLLSFQMKATRAALRTVQMTDTERQINGEVLRRLQENRDLQEKITCVNMSISGLVRFLHGETPTYLEVCSWLDILCDPGRIVVLTPKYVGSDAFCCDTTHK